jgi:hypothetical protein
VGRSRTEKVKITNSPRGTRPNSASSLAVAEIGDFYFLARDPEHLVPFAPRTDMPPKSSPTSTNDKTPQRLPTWGVSALPSAITRSL